MKFSELPIQLFGTISTKDGEAQSILCRDTDRENEVMIHWFGESIESGGVLAEVSNISTETFNLKPIRYYKTDGGGGLYAPSEIENADVAFKYSAEIRIKKNKLEGQWINHEGIRNNIIFTIPKAKARIVAKKLKNWTEFKKWTIDLRKTGEFSDFRGHGSNQFLLSTTLHRNGRGRLERFCYETIPKFRALTEATLDLQFKQADAEDFSIVLGLAQHHGLPTPLLDWTASPYVAAFFAFSDALENLQSRPEHTHVRIFALSREVSKYAPDQVALTSARPNISYLAISPRKNPRLLAQQGKFLVTNVANLEGVLCAIEKQTRKKLITAVDIPINFAVEALEDLHYMGLTAATMFPGLDGICRMMKHEMAYKNISIDTAPLPEPLKETALKANDASSGD